MIPKSVPIYLHKVYIHENSGGAYMVMQHSDDLKIGDKWLGEGVITYRKLGEAKLYSRLESDFRMKFKRASNDRT